MKSLIVVMILLFSAAAMAQEQTPSPALAESETQPVTTTENGQSAADGESPEAEDEVTVGEAFLLKLKQGGLTMVFLLLASIIGVGCAIERWAHQRRGNIAPSGLCEKADALWRRGAFDELEQTAVKSGSTLGRMIAAIVRHRNVGAADVSTIAADIASRDLKRHLSRAYPLAVVATISPLLGLFGTVVGMIGAFDQIAAMGELANPAAFGGDIGKALITTGAGLAVAIPALALYHWFKSRVSLYSVELEEEISLLITEHFMPALAEAPTPQPVKEAAHAH
jgi:biopolymer transport protein ExbB